MQPSNQQHCFHCLDGAEPHLNESTVCVKRCRCSFLGRAYKAHDLCAYIMTFKCMPMIIIIDADSFDTKHMTDYCAMLIT